METRRQGFFEGGPWRWRISRLLAGLVGLVLIVAGVLKATDMELFMRQIRDYDIISGHLTVALSAWGMVALECALGAGLLISYRPRFMLSLAALLFLGFLGATLWAWLTGATEECGCFGAWLQYSPRQAVLENLGLLVATAFAWVWLKDSQRPPSAARAWIVAAGLLAGIALPFAFGFSPSHLAGSPWKVIESELSRLEVLGVKPIDWSRGEHLLVLMDAECDHCQEAIPQLDGLAEAVDLPPLTALCPNQESVLNAFLNTFQPSFPIGRIKEEAFFRLLGLGEIPRTILLKDRRVQKVWDLHVPDRQMIEAALSK